jgi:hypothetical protein
MGMDPSENDNDTSELSESLHLANELQDGMAAFWQRLKAIKLSLSDDNVPASVNDNARE